MMELEKGQLHQKSPRWKTSADHFLREMILKTIRRNIFYGGIGHVSCSKRLVQGTKVIIFQKLQRDADYLALSLEVYVNKDNYRSFNEFRTELKT